MNKFVDMTGERYGRLVVLERVPNLPNSRVTRWKCLCDCGNIIEANRNNLLHKKVRSCGCLASELIRKRSKKYNIYEPVYIGYTANDNTPFFIDYEDFDKVKDFCWYTTANGYIATRDFNIDKVVYLHRLILNSGGVIDHINRNRTDNRKSNLRLVNAQQNCINKSIQKNNKSGITGVFYCNERKKWVAQLTYNGKKIMKRFDTKGDAIKTRKEFEELYFKEYAPK